MNSKPAHNTKPKSEKRPPKKITARYLHNSGLYYLQRYAASSAHFRAVMIRKAQKSCRHHEEQDLEDCITLIDQLVEKFIETGLLNDEVYTQGLVASLRRKGKSRKAILAKLREKGAPDHLGQEKLQHYDEENTAEDKDADLQAGLIFARKKRLGPYQGKKEIEEQKALGVFARAGFSYDIAKQILKCEAPD